MKNYMKNINVFVQIVTGLNVMKIKNYIKNKDLVMIYASITGCVYDCAWLDGCFSVSDPENLSLNVPWNVSV